MEKTISKLFFIVVSMLAVSCAYARQQEESTHKWEKPSATEFQGATYEQNEQEREFNYNGKRYSSRKLQQELYKQIRGKEFCFHRSAARSLANLAVLICYDRVGSNSAHDDAQAILNTHWIGSLTREDILKEAYLLYYCGQSLPIMARVTDASSPY